MELKIMENLASFASTTVLFFIGFPLVLGIYALIVLNESLKMMWNVITKLDQWRKPKSQRYKWYVPLDDRENFISGGYSKYDCVIHTVVFTSPLDLQKFRKVIQHRWMDLKNADGSPLNFKLTSKVFSYLGRKCFVHDENFRLDEHVVQMEIPDAIKKKGEVLSLDSFRHLANQIMSTPMDHNKPMWKVQLFPSCYSSSGELSSAWVVSFHHCIADGISLTSSLFNFLLNESIPLDSRAETMQISPKDLTQWRPHQVLRKPMNPLVEKLLVNPLLTVFAVKAVFKSLFWTSPPDWRRAPEAGEKKPEKRVETGNVVRDRKEKEARVSRVVADKEIGGQRTISRGEKRDAQGWSEEHKREAAAEEAELCLRREREIVGKQIMSLPVMWPMESINYVRKHPKICALLPDKYLSINNLILCVIVRALSKIKKFQNKKTLNFTFPVSLHEDIPSTFTNCYTDGVFRTEMPGYYENDDILKELERRMDMGHSTAPSTDSKNSGGNNSRRDMISPILCDTSNSFFYSPSPKYTSPSGDVSPTPTTLREHLSSKIYHFIMQISHYIQILFSILLFHQKKNQKKNDQNITSKSDLLLSNLLHPAISLANLQSASEIKGFIHFMRNMVRVPISIAHLFLDASTDKLTALFTNVPGPAQMLQANDIVVRDVHFAAPIRSHLGMGFGVVSYRGIMYITVMSDVGCFSDVDLLHKCICEAIREFEIITDYDSQSDGISLSPMMMERPDDTIKKDEQISLPVLEKGSKERVGDLKRGEEGVCVERDMTGEDEAEKDSMSKKQKKRQQLKKRAGREKGMTGSIL